MPPFTSSQGETVHVMSGRDGWHRLNTPEHTEYSIHALVAV